MIIRRQLYSQNKLEMKNGMEFKPIYNKAPEPNSISTGATIARDVENLLKPIQRRSHNDDTNYQPNQSSKERTERNLWRNDEVMEMLITMQQVRALEKLNDKTVKSENVFKDVELIMHRNGFVKKSHVQIWTKWKFLKSTYMTSRRNGVIPRMVPTQIYEMIHEMVSGLNQSLADSCSSLDGDSSSVSGMVISGVEGGVSDVGVTNEDDEDSFGMAHPIFGFRLGMVKSEPEDTGYEPTRRNESDKDPLDEELSSSKSDKDVKGESINNEAKINKEVEPVQRLLEVPHRGRGRPPKYPPAAASMPNNTSLSAAKSAQMPPLRVAPFAKDIRAENNIVANRPPPPLTMPPTPRIQVASLSSLKNGDPAKFAQPKLIPKPTQQHSPPVQSARISKDQIAQTRSSSTPSPSYPKMKQIPMRKTPYSLRPDRAIPDLEASLSPPPPAVEKPSNKKFEEVPTTKHLIMQTNPSNSQNIINRKRHFDWQESVPTKQAKYNSITDEERSTSKSDVSDYEKTYGKVLQNVIIDLSSSLRKMQTEMMRDFFNKQNELLEKEHTFQMQQDHMIMKAFQEQTQDIMHSVKQLVSSIKSYKNCQPNNCEENIKEAKRNRIGRVQQMRQEFEMEYNQIETNDGNNEENEIELEQQSEEPEQYEDNHEIGQDTEDTYTDGEEQQYQIEEHTENHHEDVENNVAEAENEQTQLTDEQNGKKPTAVGDN